MMSRLKKKVRAKNRKNLIQTDNNFFTMLLKAYFINTLFFYLNLQLCFSLTWEVDYAAIKINGNRQKTF